VSNGQFLRGTDTTSQAPDGGTITSREYGRSGYQASSAYFAELNSSDNWFYVNAASDSTQRAWLQFNFGNGDGSGFSIVKAVILEEGDDIDNAAAAASAVPESSTMALLALGAGGLLIRRRREAA
jgi:hypothetical protein